MQEVLNIKSGFLEIMSFRNFAKRALPVVGITGVVWGCDKPVEMHEVQGYSGSMGHYEVLISDMAPAGYTKPAVREIILYSTSDTAVPYSIHASDVGADTVRETMDIQWEKDGHICSERMGLVSQCDPRQIASADDLLTRAEKAAGAPFLFIK